MPNLTLASLYTRTTRRAYSTPEYTSAFFLEDAHIIMQDIWSDIIYERKWDRNWDIWTADTVALQTEYTKPTPSSTIVGADYIESVWVVYNTDIYTNTANKKYVDCRQATIEEKRNWYDLLENQSKSDPIYYESDWSIFIAPEVRTWESWTARIKITWVRSVASGWWTTSTSETDIKLPVFFMEVIVYGCSWKSKEFDRRDDATIDNAYQVYTREKRLAIKKLNIEKSETLDTWLTDQDFNDIV